MEQIIYLEPDDDMVTVRDRLEWAQTKRVLLVVPPQCKGLTSPLALKLLKRQAAALSLEVALVSRDHRLRELAREQGIPVFSSVRRGQRRKRWTSPLGAQALPTRRQLRRLAHPVTRPPSRMSWGERLVAALLLVIMVLLVGTLLALVVPSAEVTLVPVQQSVYLAIPVRASPDVQAVDVENMLVPGEVMQVRVAGRGQIPTTGSRDAPDAPATGTVIFVNLLNQPVEIPQGTIVSTSAGTIIRFSTVETATLPAQRGATVQVPVEAVDPGPVGNVEAHLINVVEGPLALQVRVINEEPTSGGTVKPVKIVTMADKERLKATLLQQLQHEALSRLQAQVEEAEENKFILPESLQLDWVLSETYDHFVDEEADILSLDMRVQVSGLAVDADDVNALARTLLERQIPAGFQLVEKTLSFQRGEVTEVQGRDVTFLMRASGMAAAYIDTRRIRSETRGQPLDVVTAYLQQNFALQEAPQLKVRPAWLKRMPWLPLRVRVRVRIGEG